MSDKKKDKDKKQKKSIMEAEIMRFMEKSMKIDAEILLEELRELKQATAFKQNACRDAKSFDAAIDCAIEAVESLMATDEE